MGLESVHGYHTRVLRKEGGRYESNLYMLEGIRTVLVSGVHSHDRNIILKYCVENDIIMFVTPRVSETQSCPAHIRCICFICRCFVWAATVNSRNVVDCGFL